MDLPLPQLNLTVGVVAALIAAVWAASHFIDASSRAIGAFLALIGAVVGAIAAILLRSEV